MPPVYAITLATFEDTANHPAVVHIFTGLTKKEAETYLAAHQRYDAFLAGCLQRQQFQDFRCQTTKDAGWVRDGHLFVPLVVS